MNYKSNRIVFIVIILLITGILVILCSLKDKKYDSLNIKSFDSPNKNSACKLIEVKNKAYEYSFDNGSTWTENNIDVFCDNKNITILAHDENYKIIGKVEYKVETNKLEEQNDNFSFILKEYKCKYGEKFFLTLENNYTDLNNIKVVSNDDNIDILRSNCNNCKIKDQVIRYDCNTKGIFDIKVSKNNKVISTKVIVTDSNDIVKNDKDLYTCKVGETITANINLSNNTVLKDYIIDNSEIAIVKNSDLLNEVTKLQIECKQVGETTLKTISLNDSYSISTIKVEKEINNPNVEVPNNKPNVEPPNNTEVESNRSYEVDAEKVYSCDTGTLSNNECVKELSIKYTCQEGILNSSDNKCYYQFYSKKCVNGIDFCITYIAPPNGIPCDEEGWTRTRSLTENGSSGVECMKDASIEYTCDDGWNNSDGYCKKMADIKYTCSKGIIKNDKCLISD